MESKDIVWGELIPAEVMRGLDLAGDTPVSYAGNVEDYSVWAYDGDGGYRLPADHPHYASAPSIDWTKPLELMDGTAVVLSPSVNSPDKDGDYYLDREDARPFTFEQHNRTHLIVRHDGTDWMGDLTGNTHAKVRNRAPAEVTDPYGPPIEVAGVRPAWLGDARGLFENVPDQWMDADRPLSEYAWASAGSFGACPLSIRLPRDHFAYTAIAKGFEPWGGGDEAPGDWDGGETLRADGEIADTSSLSLAWLANPVGLLGGVVRRIIGYRKAATRDYTHISDFGFSRIAESLRDHIDEAIPNTVTITRMTEDDARALWSDAIKSSAGFDDDFVSALRGLGIILPEPPEPTSVEKFEAENPGIVTDENRHWFELALGWGK